MKILFLLILSINSRASFDCLKMSLKEAQGMQVDLRTKRFLAALDESDRFDERLAQFLKRDNNVSKLSLSEYNPMTRQKSIDLNLDYSTNLVNLAQIRYHFDKGKLVIDQLHVDPEFRRLGIQEQLFNELFKRHPSIEIFNSGYLSFDDQRRVVEKILNHFNIFYSRDMSDTKIMTLFFDEAFAPYLRLSKMEQSQILKESISELETFQNLERLDFKLCSLIKFQPDDGWVKISYNVCR